MTSNFRDVTLDGHTYQLQVLPTRTCAEGKSLCVVCGEETAEGHSADECCAATCEAAREDAADELQELSDDVALLHSFNSEQAHKILDLQIQVTHLEEDLADAVDELGDLCDLS